MIILRISTATWKPLRPCSPTAPPLARRGPLVCLGDMVGYGADPEAVVRRVRAEGALAVLGNHELGVNAPASRSQFNPQAWEIVEWTRTRLS